ncbi:MAG: Lrp/AsnC family transcriptional regulator [Candidatus Diapherotrites archaeon]
MLFEELDKKDRKILYALDVDARQSLSAIGKQVGLRPESVANRIEKLERENVIRGYYAVINNMQMGYLNFRVYLQFFDSSSEIRNRIVQYLIAEPRVSLVAETESVFDLAVGIWVKSVPEFDQIWKAFLSRFREFVHGEKICLFTRVRHFRRAYLTGLKTDETKEEALGSGKQVSVDTLDLQILKELSENARIPLKELSEKTKTPPRTVAFRIRRLEKEKVIQGYHVLLNFEALGILYFKVNVELKSMQKLDEMIAYCHANPFITYVDETIGGWDLEFDIEVPSKKAFFETMEQLQRAFPEVRHYEYFGFKRYNKLLYLPQA